MAAHGHCVRRAECIVTLHTAGHYTIRRSFLSRKPLPSIVRKAIAAAVAARVAATNHMLHGKSFDNDRHQFASAYAISSTEAEIMAEIQAHGPITAGFNVYSDWVGYKSGVYTVQGGEELGGHAVVIIGWGTEDGKKYWLVRNSFGKAWGDEGYFKIQRFRGSCGIEQSLVAGLYASEALV